MDTNSLRLELLRKEVQDRLIEAVSEFIKLSICAFLSSYGSSDNARLT
jgi:hypothetical protein